LKNNTTDHTPKEKEPGIAGGLKRPLSAITPNQGIITCISRCPHGLHRMGSLEKVFRRRCSQVANNFDDFLKDPGSEEGCTRTHYGARIAPGKRDMIGKTNWDASFILVVRHVATIKSSTVISNVHKVKEGVQKGKTEKKTQESQNSQGFSRGKQARNRPEKTLSKYSREIKKSDMLTRRRISIN